jgi:hypothetical protein
MRTPSPLLAFNDGSAIGAMRAFQDAESSSHAMSLSLELTTFRSPDTSRRD